MDVSSEEIGIMARIDFNTKKLASKINKNATLFIRKVALNGMQSLISDSPFDTARFKCNWSTSINNMHSETFDAPKTPTPRGSLSSPADFHRSSKEIADYKLGQTMFLHNNLVYAIPLEYGHSKQAPKGWIRNTARLMQKKLNEIKNLL